MCECHFKTTNMERKDDFVDFYRILECDKTANFEEIKKNYQRLALSLHPDKSSAHDECESFLILQKAWSVLRDPHSRKQYDAELTCHEHSEILIYDKITSKDMKINSDGIYTYMCRCGGTYVLEMDDEMPSEVYIACDECSFSIEVTL